MSYADDYEEESWHEPPEDLYALNFEGINPWYEFMACLARTPIQVQRGGIKYPTPTTQKEHTMARSKATIQNEINSAQLTIRSLEGLIHDRQMELQKLGPAEPSQHRASVTVMFHPDGKRYEFLLIRTPNGEWYTTGARDETKTFSSWKGVVRWLNSEDIHSFSDVVPLVPQGIEQAPF